MTTPYPLSPVPSYYLAADWTSFDRPRNGVFYVGETPTLTFIAGGGGGPKSCTFETGTNGNTISTADIGTRTAFTSVSGTPTYSNTHSYDTLAGKFASGAVSYVEWTYTTVASDEYGRIYLYATANPTGVAWLSQGQEAALTVLTNGKIKIQDSLATGGHSATFTTAIALNQWVRIEWHMVYGVGATGSFECKLFNSPDSTTATETISGTSWNMGTTNNLARIGSRQGLVPGATWGSDIWLDNIVAANDAYPGPADAVVADPETLTYAVRDYYGTVVSSGSCGRHITPDEPVGGWIPGWYRIYLEGADTDALFGSAAGSTNFCVIRDDANFPAMPIPSTSGGSNGEAPDLVMKGVMGIGTSRLLIDNAYAPTTGGSTLAVITADTAISKTYWLDEADGARPRYLWTTFPNGSVDFVALPGTVADTYYQIVYPKTPAVNGATTFVKLEAGSVSGSKITVRSPDAVTVVETYDNLASASAAATALAASSYVKGFAGDSTLGSTLAATAIGTSFKDGVGSVVSTLYPLGVTRFEGPCNEATYKITPTVSRNVGIGAEIAHQMRLFQANVHAGNASAKAIGPGSVNIYPSAVEPFYVAGGGAYCDEISFHAYNAVANGDMNLGRTTIEAFQAMLATYSLSSVPLWQTESTGAFTSIYRVHHPRRARVQLMEQLLMEQYEIPRERNNPWYDISHGFWGFPQWLENNDYGLTPQCVLGRVLAEETWAKPYDAQIDFGEPGNKIFLGSLYSAADTSGTVVLMANSHIPDASVTFTIAGSAGPMTVVDGFGNESSVALVSGRVTVPVDDIPSYLRLPIGATATFYACNDWTAGDLANVASGETATVNGVAAAAVTDGGYLTLFNGASNPGSFASATSPPEDVEITLSPAQTVGRVVIWCGGVWQGLSTLLDFDVEVSTDGSNWTAVETVDVSEGATSFVFGTTDIGCQQETYWPEQTIYDVPFVAVDDVVGVRVAVRSTSYGGSPDGFYGFGGDQGSDTQHIVLQEIGVYSDSPVTEPPAEPSGLTPVGPTALTLTPVAATGLALVPVAPTVIT